ncbi:MAG: ABC transporter permease [Planctomycetota bacterium]|jgi:ABC-type transport system involved in multi-copper enzyme maturation permease subunit
MFGQILAIVRNTFFESIRQPIMLVVLVAATIALVLSNPLSAFTMEDDQRMLVDIGLATVFLCGAVLASFVATSVLTQEIENRTALTVISKPVGRPLFVLGKYLGVAGALGLSTILLSFIFLLVEQHQVIQTVRDPVHVPVIVFGLSAGVLGVAGAVWCNYFYGKVFSSTVICLTTPLAGLAYLLSLMFDHDFNPQPLGTAFRPELWMALAGLLIAVLVLAAVAIAASTRLGQVMTLCVTIGVFLLGMLSDWMFGRKLRLYEAEWLSRASQQGMTHTEEFMQTVTPVAGGTPQHATHMREVLDAGVSLSDMAEKGELIVYAAHRVGYTVVPNFQVLWLSDAVTQGHEIPAGYVGQAAVYGLLYIVVALSLATVLFQRREVG